MPLTTSLGSMSKWDEWRSMTIYDDCPTQRQICNFCDQDVNCVIIHWYKLKVHTWWLDQQRERYEGAKINIGFGDLSLITTTGYIGIQGSINS